MKKKRRTTGFRGVVTPGAKRQGKNALVETGKVIGLVVGGLAAASFGEKTLKKMLKVDDATTGMKKFIAPAALVAVGVVPQFIKKCPNEVKLVAGGVAAQGARSLIKVMVKKDILSGLGDIPETIKLNVEPYLPNPNQVGLLPQFIVEEPQNVDGLDDDYEQVGVVQVSAPELDTIDGGYPEVVASSMNGVEDEFSGMDDGDIL